MASKLMVLDKENAGGLFHAGKLNPANNGVTKSALSNVKCSQLSTPKPTSCESISHQTSQSGVPLKQRRALGDVFNTTTSNKQVNATPTAQKCLNLTKTPSSNLKSTLAGKKVSSQAKISLKMESSNVHHEMPPVEHCHIYTDTFDDLFENGKMSHLFLNQNVNFIPSLPTGNSNLKHEDGKETFHLFESINDENEWHKNIKSINKLLRRERKMDLNNVIMEMEMPELDAPMLLDD